MKNEPIRVKEFLSLPRELERKIQTLLLKKESLVTMAENITSTLNASPGGGTPEAHRMEKLLAEAADLDKRIKKLRGMKTDAEKDIADAIEKLENPIQQAVLQKKYICNKQRAQIARELHYTPTYISILENQGLENLQEILDENF